MITEKLPESLIFFKNDNCLSWEEISHIRRNVAKSTYKKKYNSTMISTINDLNYLDKKLYDYFYEKLMMRIENYGFEKMEEEKKILQNFNKKLESDCVENYELSEVLPPDQKGWTQPGVEILGPKLNSNASELCSRWKISALRWTKSEFSILIF